MAYNNYGPATASSASFEGLIPLYGALINPLADVVGLAPPSEQSAISTSSPMNTLTNVTNVMPTYATPTNIPPSTMPVTQIGKHRNHSAPESPLPPKYSTMQLQNLIGTETKQGNGNKGTAPMDIEIDPDDMETSTTPPPPAASVHTNTTAPTSTAATSTMTLSSGSTQKVSSLNTKFIQANTQENLTTTPPLTASLTPDTNLYLNNLMTNAAANFMFFPSNAATSTATNGVVNTAAATMLMDPSSMMAAAALQMQHAYTGFSLPETTASVTSGNNNNNNNNNNVTTTSGTPTTGSVTRTDPYVAAITPGAVKEKIKTKNCLLFPPNPDAPPPTIRERPLGCRTVFVGGLPEAILEEHIREIFQYFGEITTLRMSKKNFCHIRFREESSVDHAIYLSGFRLRVTEVNDQKNFGRLHVDYAQARDDQYEYECKQRQLLREQRHRERMTMDRSLSPPPIPHYTDHEASLVSEHLRSNETFLKSVQTITIWLERGDCTKRNANVFYSMIQSTHAHVRRLHADKQVLEQELRKARESYRKQMLTMSTQFTQIEKVFNAASHKKVWDHFTKAQRKNIDQWKKLASELRSVQIEDDEMEMSDEDRDIQTTAKKPRTDTDTLKEENDSLRCQIDAMRNEMSLSRTELKHDSEFREKQIKVLQETIRNLQTQLMHTKVREQKDAKTIEQLEHKLKEAGIKQLLLKTKIKELNEDKPAPNVVATTTTTTPTPTPSNADNSNDSNSITQETKDQLSESITNAEIVDLVNSASIVNNAEKTKELPLINCKITKIESTPDVVPIDQCMPNSNRSTTESKDQQQKQSFNDIKSTIQRNEVRQMSADAMQVKIAEITTESKEIPNDEHNHVRIDENATLLEEKLNNENITEITTKHHEDEAQIIALTATYLVVHPFGVTSENISSYLSKIKKDLTLDKEHLENILIKYPNLFCNTSTITTTTTTTTITPILHGTTTTTTTTTLTNSEEIITSAVHINSNHKIQEDSYWKFCGFEQNNKTTKN